jgi:hypothetical protein
MSESDTGTELAAAQARFDRALARLDGSVRNLSARMRQLQRIEVDTQRLDDSAHEVSRRLVEAMETVREVLAKT